MRRLVGKVENQKEVTSRSWEENVKDVALEPCDLTEDPLGYRAIFMLTPQAQIATGQASIQEKFEQFSVGASLLSKREEHINRAGYKAPMTRKARELLKSKTGVVLQEV